MPDLNQTVSQPLTQVIQQGTQAVQAAVPQVRQEIKTYAQNYNPTLHHLIFLGYLLGTFLLNNLRYFNLANLSQLSFLWTLVRDLVSWLAGGFLGWNLLFLDNVVYIYFIHPETNLNQQAKAYLSQRGIWAWFKFVARLDLKEKLTLRSALFQAAWVILAFFTLTSTISWFGKGLVLGLGLHLLLDQWQIQLKNPQDLNRQLFWQIKRPVSLREQKWFLGIMTGIFVILSLLV